MKTKKISSRKKSDVGRVTKKQPRRVSNSKKQPRRRLVTKKKNSRNPVRRTKRLTDPKIGGGPFGSFFGIIKRKFTSGKNKIVPGYYHTNEISGRIAFSALEELKKSSTTNSSIKTTGSTDTISSTISTGSDETIWEISPPILPSAIGDNYSVPVFEDHYEEINRIVVLKTKESNNTKNNELRTRYAFAKAYKGLTEMTEELKAQIKEHMKIHAKILNQSITNQEDETELEDLRKKNLNILFNIAKSHTLLEELEKGTPKYEYVEQNMFSGLEKAGEAGKQGEAVAPEEAGAQGALVAPEEAVAQVEQGEAGALVEQGEAGNPIYKIPVKINNRNILYQVPFSQDNSNKETELSEIAELSIKLSATNTPHFYSVKHPNSKTIEYDAEGLFEDKEIYMTLMKNKEYEVNQILAKLSILKPSDLQNAITGAPVTETETEAAVASEAAAAPAKEQAINLILDLMKNISELKELNSKNNMIETLITDAYNKTDYDHLQRETNTP